MTRFVRLTGLNGCDICLNIDKIVSIWCDKAHYDAHTEIITENASYMVKEYPDDVLRLIRNSINENIEKFVIRIDKDDYCVDLDEAMNKIKEVQEKLLGT